MADVQLVNLSKVFGGATAVDAVNLTIADGTFVTLLGPSGCGKSTTLNLIAGLEDATSGDILMDGKRVNTHTPFERDVAMVFQQYALYPHMSVAENIGFTLKLQKRPKQEIDKRVSEVAALLELTPYLARLPRELSGGQQQRVALGRAIVRQPRLFLFDEPFSNLDAALRTRMRSEIKLLHQQLGVTSIFVTHDQEEAMAISDQIVVMRSGKIEQQGTPAEVYARPASLYVARFIGTPPMDILDGEVSVRGDDVVFVAGSNAIPLGARAAATARNHGGPIRLGIRPEHVRLALDQRGATVTVTQPLGPATNVTVSWSGGTVTARLNGMVDVQPGAEVGVSFNPDEILLFDQATERLLEAP